MFIGGIKIIFGIIFCSLVFNAGLSLITGFIFLIGLIAIITGLTSILNWFNALKEKREEITPS